VKKYSKETEEWLDLIRKGIEERIDSFNSLEKDFGKSVRNKYKGVSDYFIWSPEKQTDYGAPGPVEAEVEEYWNKASKAVRAELGGKKSEVHKAVGLLLKQEYGIDIMDETLKNSDPCFALDQQAKALDWELDFEQGYKRARKIVTSKNCDHGTALYCYWCICPEYYTKFGSIKEIKKDSHKAAFKLLKEIEAKLLSGGYKSNKIFCKPMVPKKMPKDQKWQIPDILCKPNIKST